MGITWKGVLRFHYTLQETEKTLVLIRRKGSAGQQTGGGGNEMVGGCGFFCKEVIFRLSCRYIHNWEKGGKGGNTRGLKK